MAHWTKTVWNDPGAYHFTEFMDGKTVIGEVMWFFRDGPFYPHTHNRRFGAFETLSAAKEKIEREAISTTGDAS